MMRKKGEDDDLKTFGGEEDVEKYEEEDLGDDELVDDEDLDDEFDDEDSDFDSDFESDDDFVEDDGEFGDLADDDE